MPFHHSGLRFSASAPHAAQRYCYARSALLDQLLAAPGSLELLLRELTGAAPQSASMVEQLAQLKRQAIHLSVTRSAFHGLSLEEIVVLCAYTSPYFEDSAFRHQLLADLSPAELVDSCKAWLRERATHISPGEELGARRWPLLGHSPRDPAPPLDASGLRDSTFAQDARQPRDSAPSPSSIPSSPLSSRLSASFAVGVAPIGHSAALDRDLPGLAAEAGFAHEHYIACTPGTALDYVRRAASVGSTVRWDPFALDRRLRTLGLGLLLVEDRKISVYLPARYHPSPLRTPSEPRFSGPFSR